MKVGDRIRIQRYTMGKPSYQTDHTVEEFRYCLGVFLSDSDRTAGNFTPLCNLYEPGPESELKYIPNYGNYYTNLVQGWMDI
jgi:hypothetical protein